MSKISRSLCTLALVAALACVAGCAFLRGSATGSAFVEDNMRHLRLPGTDSSGLKAVAYRSPYGYEEYVRSRADGRAEAVFLMAGGTGIALSVSLRQLESLTGRWLYNRRGAPLLWAQSSDRRLVGSQIIYRRYRHRGSGGGAPRQCVAFARSWAASALDPLMRPSRAYFGYWCRPPDRPLSAADSERYLRRIELTSAPRPEFYIGQAVPHDEAALALANGSRDSGWGIQSFPLYVFRRYPIGGSYRGGQ